MPKLRSTITNAEIGAEILATFDTPPHWETHAVYEHGQWWIVCACGAQWSVHDAEPGGYGFEEVSQGDDDYEHDDD